jgi:hypothetical protein
MPRTATPFFNSLSGKAYDDLVGLIAAGESDADIANWLDCTEAYVAAVKAAIAATAASTISIAEVEALIVKAQQTRRGLAIDTSDYNDPPLPTILSSSTAAGRRTLSLPGCVITLTTEQNISSADLDLNTAGSWDTTTGNNYTVAATRAGGTFYIYAVNTPGYVVSDSASGPDGFDAGEFHKIGGFTCVKTAVGVGVPTHELSGFLAGDIIPATIWDINPATVPE